MKRLIFAALAMVLTAMSPAFAEPTNARTPTQASNSRVSAAPQVEVIAFFSYGCPHCREMSLKLDKWEAQQGKSIRLRRIPVSFGRAPWESLARSYFALSQMGAMNQELDAAIFEALYDKRKHLGEPETMKAWLQQKNVDLARFDALCRLKEMDGLVAGADSLASTFGLTGVPAIWVNGEFVPGGKADAQIESASKAVAKLRDGK